MALQTSKCHHKHHQITVAAVAMVTADTPSRDDDSSYLTITLKCREKGDTEWI